MVGAQGEVAHDAVDSGNPVKIGGIYESTPDTVESGDRVNARFTERGAMVVAIGEDSNANLVDISVDGDAKPTGSDVRLATHSLAYGVAPDTKLDRFRTLGDIAGAGLGVLAAAPWIPGASDVKSIIVDIGATSASVATIIDTTDGKKARIISVQIASSGLITDPVNVQVYFGTGANITTTPSNAIGEYVVGLNGSTGQEWPDGGGPVGLIDDAFDIGVVSWRTNTETETELRITVHYREE
jgi:hypothetical protein